MESGSRSDRKTPRIVDREWVDAAVAAPRTAHVILAGLRPGLDPGVVEDSKELAVLTARHDGRPRA